MAQKDIFLVSDNSLRTSGYIDRNISGDILMPAVRYVQDNMVEHIVGTSLFRKLKNLIENSEINNEENAIYSNLVNGYIFDVIMWGVMAEIQVPLSLKTRNKGLVSSSDEHLQNAYLAEVKYIESYYRDKADYYRLRLRDYLCGDEAVKNMPELKGCPARGELRAGSGEVRSNFCLTL